MSRSPSRGWIAMSRTATFGKPAGEAGPAPAAVHRDEEAELGAEEEEVRVHQVLRDHVGVAREGVASPAASRSCRSRPSCRRRSSCRRSRGRRRWRRRSPRRSGRPRRSRPRSPSAGRATFGATLVQVCAAVAGHLQVAVVGAHPDHLARSSATRRSCRSWCGSRRDELSTDRPPDSCCFCFFGSLVVRSGEMRSQESPRSRERKRNWAPM